MNLQIFGKAKCFDTKKAQRYCKERRLKFQNIDLLSKGLSKRELTSVLQCVGYDAIVDPKHPDAKWFRSLFFDDQKFQALLDDPSLIRTPSSATDSRPPWATARRSGSSGRRRSKNERRNDSTVVLSFGSQCTRLFLLRGGQAPGKAERLADSRADAAPAGLCRWEPGGRRRDAGLSP